MPSKGAPSDGDGNDFECDNLVDRLMRAVEAGRKGDGGNDDCLANAADVNTGCQTLAFQDVLK